MEFVSSMFYGTKWSLFLVVCSSLEKEKGRKPPRLKVFMVFLFPSLKTWAKGSLRGRRREFLGLKRTFFRCFFGGCGSETMKAFFYKRKTKR